MRKLKIVSQKPAFHAKHFYVNQVAVSINGKADTYHHVVIKPAVFVLPLNEKNELYLIKAYRYNADKEYIEVTAGMVDEGEDIESAARRELQEETGLQAKTWKYLGVTEQASSTIKVDRHYFLAQDLEKGEQNLDSDEEIEVIKMPLQTAVNKIMSGEINNEKSIVGILWLNELLRVGKL